MRFTCIVVVNKPIQEVVDLWSNSENLKHWQDGLISFNHTEGEEGAVGSKSIFEYQQGKQHVILEETILISDLPNEFKGVYRSKPMSNTMHNHFSVVSENQTEWKTELEYIEMNGLIPTILVKLFPGMMRKQTQKWLDQFKAFAEKQ